MALLMDDERQHVFIVGSRGIPSRYGGFESFVDHLTRAHAQNDGIRYHVACLGSSVKEYEYNGAHCFQVRSPKIGPARAIHYDWCALLYCIRYIRRNNVRNGVVYMLGSGTGPVLWICRNTLLKLGIRLYVNPDGREWLRAKWGRVAKKYLRYSERIAIKSASLVICDSMCIEDYVRTQYAAYSPSTVFIPYGAEVRPSTCGQEAYSAWLGRHDLAEGQYYLAVARLVPENNLETLLREFMNSCTTRRLVLVTDSVSGRYFEYLKRETGFSGDPRIVFVGAVYEQELLRRIREGARAYIHGHEVGGTNPSLLESLASTNVNLLMDVSFNREVAADAGRYFTKEPGSLQTLIELVDAQEGNGHGCAEGHERIRERYSWPAVAEDYARCFLYSAAES